tara:strand:- start:465 stop:785 length:321 start_codon:yes stop_codon:yes gene_type:complete
MRLSEAIELVLDEAETSALGDLSENKNSQEVIKALDVVRDFYDNHGKRFRNYTTNELECSTHAHSDFCDDKDKMVDFNELTKEEFLSSYSYTTEEEYNLTRMKQNS